MVTVKFNELRDAFDFANFDGDTECNAFIDRQTGKLHCISPHDDFGDDEEQEDADRADDYYDDASRYLAVPDKRDLDLGRELVFSFVAEHLPDDHDRVRGYFHKRGAYARFKDLLDLRGLLDAWHLYEKQATDAALRDWFAENDVCVDPMPSP